MTTDVMARPVATVVTPFDDALTCLRDADVRHALLRDDLAELAEARDLDLLVDPADRKLLAAALGRAGFLPKHDRRFYRKALFVRWDGVRFSWIDVHFAFVQGGVEYMDAKLALGRLDRNERTPRLSSEDRFVHVWLHNLLGKPALQAKHAPLLQRLHARGLDRGRVIEQAARFGLVAHAERMLDDFDRCTSDPAVWDAMRRDVRRILGRRPGSWIGRFQFRYGDRLRLRFDRRPVVIALLGPDGSGKTTFADELQATLHDSPLRAGRVYMGSWGHDLLPMRSIRRLIPPQVSPLRVMLARSGASIELSAEERRLVASRPSLVGIAALALRTELKSAAFHTLLGVELAWRFVRGIRMSRRSIVISDRWVHDLEFRQGKIPFVHGQVSRRLFYRLFPAPDGIVYLETPYDLVEKRKPQLDRAQFEAMDAAFRRVLAPASPLFLTSDAPPDALVRRFLTQHWETLIARCNRRA